MKGLSSFMAVEWGMSPPSVIVAVTGDATDTTLRPRFEQQFTAALLNATRTANAWITTGGTNAGIMRQVGDALKEYVVDAVCFVYTCRRLIDLCLLCIYMPAIDRSLE